MQGHNAGASALYRNGGIVTPLGQFEVFPKAGIYMYFW